MRQRRIKLLLCYAQANFCHSCCTPDISYLSAFYCSGGFCRGFASYAFWHQPAQHDWKLLAHLCFDGYGVRAYWVRFWLQLGQSNQRQAELVIPWSLRDLDRYIHIVKRSHGLKAQATFAQDPKGARFSAKKVFYLMCVVPGRRKVRV